MSGALLILMLVLSPILQVEKAGGESGTITGKVVADDGQPMAGAVVSAFSPNSAAPVSRTVTADEEGNFKFLKLPLGNYQLIAGRPGYVLHDNLASVTRLYRTGENALLTMTRGGVIAGRVSDNTGEPVIEIGVNAMRIGSIDGKSRPSAEQTSFSMRTDDRGQYRIFGLPPGRYLVRANAPMYFMREGDPHLGEKTIYYPSTGIESAQEVVVNPGEVVSGIDIRYRGEPGLRVSGRITGLEALKTGLGSLHVNLFSLPGKSRAAFTNSYGSGFETFVFTGISDGQYLIEAVAKTGNTMSGDVFRVRRQLTVKGTDLSNVALNIVSYANVEAQVIVDRVVDSEFEKLKIRRTAVEELAFVLKPEGPDLDDDLGYLNDRDRSACDTAGRIAYRGLPPSTYRFVPQFPGPELYLKSIGLQVKNSAGKTALVEYGKTGLKLRPGDRLKGIEIGVSEGAASIEGTVKARPGSAPRARYGIYLVPAEIEARENLLRYYETTTDASSGFSISNIEPGQYYLLAYELADTDLRLGTLRPRMWDSTQRAAILRLASVRSPASKVSGNAKSGNFDSGYAAMTLAPGARITITEVSPVDLGKK